MIAQTGAGNARLHFCAYHSRTFDSAGRNKNIKWKKGGCYPPAFDEENHDLAALPAFGEYRGFLFGSLVGDVPTLDQYLGEAAKLLDLVADQSEEGLELVPGGVTFTYEGNWKLQLENCSDQYHFTSTHPSYIRVLENGQMRRLDPLPSEIAYSEAASGSFRRAKFPSRKGRRPGLCRRGTIRPSSLAGLDSKVSESGGSRGTGWPSAAREAPSVASISCTDFTALFPINCD